MTRVSNAFAGSSVAVRLVDLNNAPREILAALPLVGSKRAKALVQYRPHRNWDEVEQIPGFDRFVANALQWEGAYLGASNKHNENDAL